MTRQQTVDLSRHLERELIGAMQRHAEVMQHELSPGEGGAAIATAAIGFAIAAIGSYAALGGTDRATREKAWDKAAEMLTLAVITRRDSALDQLDEVWGRVRGGVAS